MNFSKYSLKEHIEYAIDSLYVDHRIDIACTIEDELYEQSKGYGKVVDYLTSGPLKQLKSTVSMNGTGKYNIQLEDFVYHSSFGTEKFQLPNIFFELRKDKVHAKSFSTTNAKVISNKDNKREIHLRMGKGFGSRHTVYPSRMIKEFESKGCTFIEETTSTGKLTKSKFKSSINSKYFDIQIGMEKKVSHTEGVGYVKYNNIQVNFKFEDEPSFMRLLSNKFIFNILIETELGTIIEDVRTALINGTKELSTVLPYKLDSEKAIEYYTNGH